MPPAIPAPGGRGPRRRPPAADPAFPRPRRSPAARPRAPQPPRRAGGSDRRARPPRAVGHRRPRPGRRGDRGQPRGAARRAEHWRRPPPRAPVPPRAPRRRAAAPVARCRGRTPPRGSRGLAVRSADRGRPAVALVAGHLAGGPSPNRPSAPRRRRTRRRRAITHQAGGLQPRSVTVAVLNGTATNRLAHRGRRAAGTDRLQAGNDRNTSDQTQTTTVVAYLPGHKADALAVAKALKLGSPRSQPSTRTRRPSPVRSLGLPADVVVTVGADLATAVAARP